MKPGDHSERLRALESDRNLAVTAGAGTGKTTLLVSKILRKVMEEGVDIRRILALTFTEKAASEMLDRLRRELEKKGRAKGLERAEIGTIHSFCAHVLRQFPIEAGVVPDFKVDEGAAFRRLFNRAWPRWLNDELAAASPRAQEWRRVLAKVRLKALRGLAEELASFLIPEERGDGRKALSEFAGEAVVAAPELAPFFAGKGDLPKEPKKPAPAVKRAYRLAKDISSIDEETVRGAIALVEDFARAFRRDYLAQGYVSFDGMLSLVHDLLSSREFPGVAALLREKYEYILVDEFQDTDPLQGEIIRKLAEGPDGRLVPGKLFLVGDPKQSIYSFRGADIVAYHGLVNRILQEGGEPIVLRTNFRSHAQIIEMVNVVFSRVIVENGALQAKYEPIEPCEGRKPAHEGPSLEAILIDDARAGESREAEAEAIAEWILARREIPYRDIAILFKALTDVSGYIEALRARGIPYVVEGEKYFYGTTEVIDFVNLLRAVANPHDRIAIAGVLRSPFGGLPDQELYDRRKNLDYRADSDLPIFRFLRRWHEREGTVGVAELIDVIFEESYALEIAQAGYHGEQAVANLIKLRSRAAELEAEGGCTLREFLEVVTRAVREREEEGESPLADESLDTVRMLSIHKSKGLEFPVVILPDLHRQTRPKEPPVVRFDWPRRTLGVWLDEACDAGGAALAHLDRDRRREEDRRLLYVAATRAREILVMLGSAQAGEETYLGLLRPDLEKHARVSVRPYRRPSIAARRPEGEKEKPDWEAFTAHWRERDRRGTPLPRITSPSALERGEEEEAPAPLSRAAEIGIACHKVLEHLDFRKPSVPKGADAEVAKVLRDFFKSAAFRELAESDILARELPFFHRREGQVLQGVIDVVYRHRGKLFVGDYKTDKIVEPADYALIRDCYTEAARRVFGEAPGFRLFYLRQKEVVEA